METAPKVGTKIKVKPDHRYFPCTGIVTKVHPKRKCLVADDDYRWDDPDFIPAYGGPAPESAWKVSMQVDAPPRDWAYGDRLVFCPDVAEVELAQ